jgi:hypothetical protein
MFLDCEPGPRPDAGVIILALNGSLLQHRFVS